MYFYRNDFWTPGQISLLSYCNCNEGYIGGIAPIYTWGNWYTLTVSANASGYVFAYLNGSLLYQQQFTGFVRWYQRHTTTGMPAASPPWQLANERYYNRALSVAEVLQLYYQAPIVTSGLTYAVDMSNVMSYSGAGTSINTFVPSSTAGVMTMYNGIGFNNSYGGYLSVDGVDDYASCSDSTNRFGTPSSGNSMTFVITFKTYETTQVNGSDFLLGDEAISS